jgi:putative (di)nucleoside polyphosphate hydrolase
MAGDDDHPYGLYGCSVHRDPPGVVHTGPRARASEHAADNFVWQMPQGGVDDGEDTWAAAMRELYEETSARSVEKLGEISEWLTYDIPRTVAGRAWKGRYRGQRQKWYAIRFTGSDSEINVENPGDGYKPEFVSWRWEPMQNLPGLIVPFKRPVYERVVREFARFGAV